jgi:hypothetical protein
VNAADARGWMVRATRSGMTMANPVAAKPLTLHPRNEHSQAPPSHHEGRGGHLALASVPVAAATRLRRANRGPRGRCHVSVGSRSRPEATVRGNGAAVKG